MNTTNGNGYCILDLFEKKVILQKNEGMIKYLVFDTGVVIN